jgi:SWIM zinc finger
MPARWSAESVLALAPDDASAQAGARLARPAPWSGTGAAGDLVWGLCAGSGKNPYQAIVDLSGPAYRCSCPSRKFPCKHALALLMLWADGSVPDATEPAGYALAWLESRREKASQSLSRTAQGAPPASAASGAAGGDAGGSGAGSDGAARRAAERAEPVAGGSGAGTDGAARRAAERAEPVAGGSGAGTDGAARRAAERAERVAGGLAELAEWLRDQVRMGLAASVSVAGTRVPAAPGAAALGGMEAIAARMVDAQAPGVAGVLRALSWVPASGDGWPARLLADYARLHLLARAHARLDVLPPGLAAVVRSRVGYTTGRQEVLALPAVTDHWLVTGVRDLVEGTVPGRRIWLAGRDSGRHAMLLTFAGNGYWQDPETARLRAGTELFADVHYYPGQPPLRGLTGVRHADPVPGTAPPGSGVDALLAGWADGLAADPWLTTWPAVLTGTPAAAPEGEPWHLVDQAGAAVPLADQESLWKLLAVSGGHPVTVAGEWHGERLLPLTVWHGEEAVPL